MIHSFPLNLTTQPWVPPQELVTYLKRFEGAGIIKRVKEQYSLRGVHAE